jgi:predicted nucleic acid-binding protein
VELADTSAWTNRHKDAAVQADFDARVLANEIATCSMVAMELLWTARSQSDFAELRDELDALPQLPITPAAWERAIAVWHELVQLGRHRQTKPPDLLIAAVAELAGVGLCHYDNDFDAIAAVTGQPVRPLAPIGSL